VNILIVIRWPVGGIQTYCKYVYGLPVFDGCDFTVITTKDADEEYFRNAFGARLRSLYRLTESEFSAGAILRIGWQGPRPQLLHAHGFSSGILAILARLVLGVPLLLTSHDIVQESQFRGLRGIMKRLALATALRMSARVNVVGTDAGENLRSFFPRACSPEKVSIILNGIDVEQFSDGKCRDLRSEVGVGRDVLLMGFFGRFMAQKGFRYILDMLEQHRDLLQAELHVACFGWGGFIREEQAEIARRGLNGNFSFLPATHEMPAALRGCDAVIMPSLWEAMPLLAMEALVAGTPLIASACIGLREVCMGSPALMCAPGDSRSLVDAVNRFVNGRALHEAAARQYQSEAIRRFDRKETGARLRALYDVTAAREPGVGRELSGSASR
jgi:glycosyltransferase involved in cell wall biosynthesis